MVRDRVGEAALELFAASGGYNELLWKSLRALSPPRGRVLEVGCGIGNLTRLLLVEPRVDSVHAIDVDPAYVQRTAREIGDPRLEVSACAAESFLPPEHAAAADASFDSLICSNVLEHIEDDVAALRNFRRMLRPGGEALVLVPAHPWLFCELDRNLSHHRRYTPSALRDLSGTSGLSLVTMRHFNPLGILGWWLNGKVLRRSVLPPRQLRLYSRFAVSVSGWIDRLNPFPLGISLLALYRREGA